MNINKKKSECQSEALNAWHKRGCRGTLQLCTGAGKTYAALRAIKWVFKFKPDANILIICPTEIIRDDTFPKEFKKWKMAGLLKKVDLKCIQTVYKYENEHYDLIVADEFHNYLPEKDDYKSRLYEYHKFFERNTYDKILGLSAWIPEKKRMVARKIAPICHTLTTDEGVRRGIISPYVEFNVPIILTGDEKAAYARVQMAYFNLERQLGGFKAFDTASKLMKFIGAIAIKDRTKKQMDDYQLAIRFYKTMHKRKTLLYNVGSKADVVLDLIDFLKIEKSVIFSQSTLFADLICHNRNDIIPYHSKVKDRSKSMKRFNDKRTKVNHLSTCMAVNEGMDLPKLPVIIIAARTSGAKTHIQRRGRCLRFEEGKVSYVFNLYLKDTQDEKWLIKSQSTTAPENIIFVNSVDEVVEKVKSLNKELTSLDVE